MPVINYMSHRTGQGYLTEWTPEKVALAGDPVMAFAEYATQIAGAPWATVRDLTVLRQRIGDIFDRYPQATYYTLCRVVQYCLRKGLRFSRIYFYIDEPFRKAWAERALPELDEPVRDEGIEQRIADALQVETDPAWRRRLICCMGTSARSRTLADWMHARGGQ
jgi:hypothetical protein